MRVPLSLTMRISWGRRDPEVVTTGGTSVTLEPPGRPGGGHVASSVPQWVLRILKRSGDGFLIVEAGTLRMQTRGPLGTAASRQPA